MAERRFNDGLESPRIAGLPFVLTALGVLVFLGVSFGVLWTVFISAVPDRVPLPAQSPPAPRLLANPPTEVRAVWAQQRARLNGYRWVDRASKLASIPIDRAMAIIAARGVDGYAPIAGAPPAPESQIPASTPANGAPP